jgi:hypothetical protein
MAFDDTHSDLHANYAYIPDPFMRTTHRHLWLSRIMMMLDSCLIYQARAFFPVVAQQASNGGSFRSSLRRIMTPSTPVLAHQRRRLVCSRSAHANEDNGDTSIRKNENIIDKQNAKRNHVMTRHLKREDRISFLEYSRKNGVELSISEQKELQGLLSTNSDSDSDVSNFVEQYSSLGFSEEHVAFKATHNQVFARLISYCQSKHSDRTINVFYLDGPCGGTTETLLMSYSSSSSTTARLIEPHQCYTANRHASTCRALQQRFPAVHVQHASAEDALLQTRVPFHAYYFDACGGQQVYLSCHGNRLWPWDSLFLVVVEIVSTRNKR